MSTMTVITAPLTDNDIAFIKGMKAAIEERGEDFVYPRTSDPDAADWYKLGSHLCQYSKRDGTPACIVGLALAKAGIDVPPFGPSFPFISVVAARYSDGLSESVVNAAGVAQRWQDMGKSWGDALEKFFDSLGGAGITVTVTDD